MLKIFVAFLLIAEGIATSDICDKRCNSDYLDLKEFPQTSEDLRSICKLGIEYMECDIHHKEVCQELDSKNLQRGYKFLAAVREICSEGSLLHAAVVDNLQCLGKLVDSDYNKECYTSEPGLDRVLQFAEHLTEEGLVSLTDYENDTYKLYECIGLMNIFACQSLIVESKCGYVAMYVYAEIMQKVGPGVILGCEESYHLLPAIIRLRKVEEEKQRSIAEVFKKRK